MTLPLVLTVLGIVVAILGFIAALFCKKLHLFKRGAIFLTSAFYSGYVLDLIFRTFTSKDFNILLSTVFLSPIALATFFCFMIPNKWYDQVLKEPTERVSFVGDVQATTVSTDENPSILIYGKATSSSRQSVFPTRIALTYEQGRNLWGELGGLLNKRKTIK